MDKLGRIKDTAYNILVDFDEFCRENLLTYYLCSGTLLGAVRHGDFIPWDDDIDVAMPRSDYEKLISSVYNQLPEQLKLEHHNNSKNYFLNFAKIMDKNTTLVEKMGGDVFRIGGVYIDIFPIDGAGNNFRYSMFINKIAHILKVLIQLSAGSYSKKKRALWKRIIIRSVSLFKPKTLQRLLNFIIKHKKQEKSKYVGIFAGGSFDAIMAMEKEIFGTPTQIQFRDKCFYAPAQAREYLRRKYGENFMDLPPIEKRISHHNFAYVDLDAPYDTFNMELLHK